MSLLHADNLVKRFGGMTAVDGVSLSLAKGEVVSIIGPNGSGKTTTLNLITGVLSPDAGSVSLDGQAITGRRPHQIAQLGLTRTFQNGRVIGNLTVRDNVLVGLEATRQSRRPLHGLRGLPGLRWLPMLLEVVIALLPSRGRAAEAAQDRDVVDEQLRRFGARLAPRVEQYAYTLSYANRRRTEIARALVSQPKVLVLDEPTAGMNQTETAEVLQQLLDLKAEGLTILLVEHKLDLVMTLSDRVIVLDGGRLISEGTPEEVRADPAVIEAYLGTARPQEQS